MDLIYGKRASQEEDVRQPLKKSRPDVNLPAHAPSNLPVHLPNDQVVSDTPIHVHDHVHEEQEQEQGQESTTKANIAIPGTDITLNTQEDIEAWIKQRKVNWMKKISNSKPSDSSEDSKEAKVVQKRRQLQGNQRNNNVVRGEASRNKAKFNLNKAIIQRELAQENLQILDVIRELFDQGILDVKGLT